jgi:HEAT repeat protein
VRPNIWKLQAERDIDGLINALQYQDPDIRKRAAAALRLFGTTKAIFALERAFEEERNPYVREHISSALTYLRHEDLLDELVKNENVPGLIEMLNSPRSSEVQKAIEALGSIGDRTATEGLVIVFRNAMMADELRLAAAEALLKLESAPAVITLLAALRKDDWQVRRNAVTVLGQLKATWATTPLINMLSDAHAKVRKSAEYALTQINTSHARDALQKYRRENTLRQTTPLPDIVNQQFDLPAPQKSTKSETVGGADQESDTSMKPPVGLREKLREQIEASHQNDDALSPALAAAEAALAQLSPDGQTLFDETESRDKKDEPEQSDPSQSSPESSEN